MGVEWFLFVRFFLFPLSLFSFQGPTLTLDFAVSRRPRISNTGSLPAEPDLSSCLLSCRAVSCSVSEKGSTAANLEPSTLFFHFFFVPSVKGRIFFLGGIG
jgi:hypothetical protein